LGFGPYGDGRQLIYEVKGETYLLVGNGPAGFKLEKVSVPASTPVTFDDAHC